MLGVLTYTGARVGALARLRRGDLQHQETQRVLRFAERVEIMVGAAPSEPGGREATWGAIVGGLLGPNRRRRLRPRGALPARSWKKPKGKHRRSRGAGVTPPLGAWAGIPHRSEGRFPPRGADGGVLTDA